MSDTKIAQSDHCGYCFDMLLEELTNVPSEYNWSTLPLGDAKMPVFVTWYKHSTKRRDDQLRGCLGTFSQELPIRVGLKKYSIMSALNDKRFDPIPVKEISYLKCSISLLHSFTRAKSWDDWELGKHGITIHFSDDSHQKTYNATYLPEVPGQQRWNKITTVENLVNKAGFEGPASLVKNLIVTKYESCKYQMTWQQYLEFVSTKPILRKRIAMLQSITTKHTFNIIIAGMNGINNTTFDRDSNSTTLTMNSSNSNSNDDDEEEDDEEDDDEEEEEDDDDDDVSLDEDDDTHITMNNDNNKHDQYRTKYKANSHSNLYRNRHRHNHHSNFHNHYQNKSLSMNPFF